MDRHILFLVLLAVFLFFTVPIFAGAGEERLDVYISVFTIEYLALVGILRPRRKLLTRLRLDPVGLGLFIIFCFIVARKIIEILVPWKV